MKKKLISFRATEEMIDYLDRCASEGNISRAQYLRELVADAYAHDCGISKPGDEPKDHIIRWRPLGQFQVEVKFLPSLGRASGLIKPFRDAD